MRNNQFRLILLVAIIPLLSLSLVPRFAFAVTVDEIAGSIICQCGCIMVVSTCECGTADQTKALIQGKIDKGETKEQIMKYFVDQYGEKVLAAPSKSGFNVTAWIIPFAALLFGAGVIYMVVRKWVISRQTAKVEIRKETKAKDIDDKYRSKLEEELRSFE
ncbi:MAG: cytochrome c-type biogenesis protein CcmH [Candidatus Tectomicrobia bacterium]|uniref:Cytochrome c-type biogenesis protein n=1 Tax=Tectimicrobiota bacterium TaxID=2528274 RepID=A0A933GKJ3_UNCTE|nr:cytochrome c-type biogenesis protein CcmH [Candidatus Tectomicrobia bacterium]